MDSRALPLWLLLTCGTWLSGCRAQGPAVATMGGRVPLLLKTASRSSDPEHLAWRRGEVYARTANQFKKAALLKPTSVGSAVRTEAESVENGGMAEEDLAPLIVHERVPLGSSSASQDDSTQPQRHAGTRFGALRQDKNGRIFVDVDNPTVYVSDQSVTIAGTTRPALAYWWYYDCAGASEPVVARKGIRTVIGDDGFPQVWQVFDESCDDPNFVGPRIFFVSRSVEAAAEKQFGPPLPGRRYAVEPSVNEAPEVVVAGIVEDGPVPMGPYVYLDAPARRITTLLCRCSPAQMHSVVETAYYDLVPAIHMERVPSWTWDDPAAQAGGLRVGPSRGLPLDAVLRWPAAGRQGPSRDRTPGNGVGRHVP